MPTLFCFTKQTNKRKSTERRQESSEKRQLVEDAFENLEEIEIHQKENLLLMNSKSSQTEDAMVSFSTQTVMTCFQQVDKTTQTIEEHSDNEDVFSQFSQENDVTFSEADESFYITADESSSDEREPEEEYECQPSGSAFIVYWSCLSVLLQRCLTCSAPAFIKKVLTNGSALCCYLSCENDHQCVWRSQPLVKRYYIGNLRLSASVLFSSNTYRKLSKYFQILNIPWVSKSIFYQLQEYMFGVTNEAWEKEQASIVLNCMDRNVVYSGDGRCDSPGHNAKYLTYSLFDQDLQKVSSVSVTQVTEVDGVSNRMEKAGLVKVLDEVKNKDVKISQLTTDRHLQIKKYMREQEEGIDHQFDVWHFSKSIKTKLLNASKKKSSEELRPWIKSICNHLWWSCATCDQNEVLLKEKWISLLFHIQNKHQWTGHIFYHECCHADLSPEEERSKAWLSPESDSFLALQAIVLDKTILKDLVHLTKFSHTGILEVYHSVLNKWAPKSTHFSYKGMVARCKLAAMDFNLGQGLQQAKTKQGDERYNVCFSKITKTWSAKPIKETKSLTLFSNLVDQTVDAVIEGKNFKDKPIPNLPKNIAPIEKPDKHVVLRNQKSRFDV